MALSIVKLGTKVGVVGGAAYYSVQQGIWGNTQEGTDAMMRLSEAIYPPGPGEPMTRQPSPLSAVATENWNKGAKILSESATQIPDITKEYFYKASDAVSSLWTEK